MIDRSDPLWYKDAVIYQLHIKAFFDANNDGIGDFAGLMQKLDYVQELGVNTVWVLPFYPSPLRDDGYDIADYRNINPSYGTMRDFRRFVRAAHERGLRVITELVINHTSDQHPWFQRARQAKPGSAHRKYYVWSDTDQRYQETRIIFIDTEPSNWSWDPVAQQYFWHRFYHHQPDLNFDNPTGDARDPAHPALLARDGHRRAAPRRDPLSRRARRHDQREPARDPCGPEAHPRRGRAAFPRPHAARRGQPVARGRAALLRRRRRVPHVVPLPRDAAHVHGDRPGGPAPDRRHPAPDAGHPATTASGASSCATTTS